MLKSLVIIICGIHIKWYIGRYTQKKIVASLYMMRIGIDINHKSR